MIHLLNQTLTHYPKGDFDEEGDVRYEAGTTVRCRFVPKDYTSDEVEGVSKQLHAKGTVMASANIKAFDKVTYRDIDYIIWRVREKVQGNGSTLFYVFEAYRQDTNKG